MPDFPDHPAPLPQALERPRERTIALLCEHFAQDHLDTDELERRLDAATRAVAVTELDALLQDLPALPQSATPTAYGPRRAPTEEVAERGFLLAIMGGTERQGDWTPPREINAFSIMGSIQLDFREARFGPGVTVLNLVGLMSGTEITLPPGVRVETQIIPIMGGADVKVTPTTDPDAPTLRIQGLLLMAGVEVRERLPGESKQQAKLRRREEARLKNEERKQLRGRRA